MPLRSLEKPKDGSLIAIWEITESEETLQKNCTLSNSEREELLFITSEQRRKERFVVHLLLSTLIDRKHHLKYEDNGRPFLQNETGNISITHTKRFACIIYHPKVPVGIDIECTLRNFSTIEKKFLSTSECDYLSQKDRNLQLCIIWATKEAVYKRISDGDINFAKQIIVEKFTPHKQGKLNAKFIGKTNDVKEFVLHYRCIDDHVMVWTTE